MYYGAHTQWWRGRVGGCCCAVSPSHPTGSGAELSHPLGQPRGRGDAHAVPLAPGSSLLLRHTTQPWCGGDAPPGAFWGAQSPPTSTALAVPAAPHAVTRGCTHCLVPSSRGPSVSAVSGSPPCASSTEQQCSTPLTAELRTAPQPHGAHVGAAACNIPTCRCAQLLSQPACTPCCTSPPGHRAHRRHSAPHRAPQQHPDPGPPFIRATPMLPIPHPRAAGSRNPGRRAGSSRLCISGFWFPFLLPAVSMETGVGPGKIRLGFAWGPSASARRPPAGGHTHTHPPRDSGTRHALTSPTLPPREPRSQRVLGHTVPRSAWWPRHVPARSVARGGGGDPSEPRPLLTPLPISQLGPTENFTTTWWC